MRRRRARTDANHSAVIGALRACGATVQDLSAVGDGCPDLLVGHRGRNFAIEVKDGSKAPSARKLTEDQERWHRDWRGQVVVVNSIEEAIAALATIPEQAHPPRRPGKTDCEWCNMGHGACPDHGTVLT